MNILQKIVIEPLAKSLDNILLFLPNLLTSLLLFLLGVVVSLLLKLILEGLFKAIGINRLSTRFGFGELLKKGGIADSPSHLLAKLVGGTVFLIFTLLSMRALEVGIVERLTEKFLFYLPNVVIAFLILLSGWLLGNFLGRAALIAAVNAGIRLARFIAIFVKYMILTIAATMALEHVGIGKETVEIAFTVLFSGIVFAIALAFGLGGKDIAHAFLEKRLNEDKSPDDDGISYL